MGALSADVLTLCSDLSTCLKSNIQRLRDSDISETIDTHLRDWGVVLGILADDVLESIVLLFDRNMIRGGNMLSRALEDYDVRLRFYIVQSVKSLAQYKNKGIKSPKNLRGTIRAIRDWENANYKLVSVLNLYEPWLWSPETRATMDQILRSNEQERNNSFSGMVGWLIKDEVAVRGVIKMLSERVVSRYTNMLAGWRMQSAFLHGDQVIISDVFEFDDSGKRTGRIFQRSSVPPTIMLFTAIDNVIEIIRSFGMITNSMTPGVEAIRDRAAALWHSTRQTLWKPTAQTD